MVIWKTERAPNELMALAKMFRQNAISACFFWMPMIKYDTRRQRGTKRLNFLKEIQRTQNNLYSQQMALQVINGFRTKSNTGP